MFSIGEFSKICMVTTKTLRHYDTIGLLKPYEQDYFTNYRYYTIEQIDIMLKINHFKKYGFTLKEIKCLLQYDEKTLNIKLFEKAKELENKILQNEILLKNINQDILDLKQGEFMKNNINVEIVDTKDINIAFVKDEIAIKNFPEFINKLFALKLPITGNPLTIYHSEKFDPDCSLIEIAHPTTAKTENTRILKGGLCAKTVLKGAYSQLSEVYMNLCKWISENNYKIANPPYDVYLNDPHNTPENELITEIYFPIKIK